VAHALVRAASRLFSTHPCPGPRASAGVPTRHARVRAPRPITWLRDNSGDRSLAVAAPIFHRCDSANSGARGLISRSAGRVRYSRWYWCAPHRRIAFASRVRVAAHGVEGQRQTDCENAVLASRPWPNHPPAAGNRASSGRNRRQACGAKTHANLVAEPITTMRSSGSASSVSTGP